MGFQLPLYIQSGPAQSGIHYDFGLNLYSGQETQYHLYDEKWLFDNGFFSYTPPPNPTHRVRLVDFFTLADNNVFGNTNRFTNTTGGAPATGGGPRITVDHFTGLDWQRAGFGSHTFANWLSVAYGNTFDGGGWIAPSVNMYMSIARFEAPNQFFNHSGINLSGSFSLWACNTSPGNTANGVRVQTSAFALNSNAKTNISQQHLACRRSIYAV